MTDNRTTELLPCPFCGGEMRITLVGDEFDCCWWQVSRGTDSATACHCRVFMESDRKWQVNDNDEPEDYPLASAEKRWLIEKWNTRAERTCKFVSSKGSDYPPVCSACGYELGIYDCEWYEDGTYGYERNYCPNCGAKVIDAQGENR